MIFYENRNYSWLNPIAEWKDKHILNSANLNLRSLWANPRLNYN